ncbi:MAG: class 1 fructose-bisphosphatase [Planctomycetota bacterium]
MPIERSANFITVQQHIAMQQEKYRPGSSGEFSWLLSAITLATKIISSQVRSAGLIDVWGEDGSTNVQGEKVQKLDLMANEILKKTLGYRNTVGIIASEEDNDPKVLKEVDKNQGKYIVMFDPLDGSSNIDVNVSVGTIFTVWANPPDVVDTAESVLQPGTAQVAAGYVVYGSSTVLVYTTGQGVHMFTLDPDYGAFLLVRENITIPDHLPQYSCNEAYYHTFPSTYQRYLAWAKTEGEYSSRYVGSLVADFHRILLKGGVYLYPPTEKNPSGKLRLMYECNPLAMIAEQAGGKASTGTGRVLEAAPSDVHDRAPLIIGASKNVDEVLRFVRPD